MGSTRLDVNTLDNGTECALGKFAETLNRQDGDLADRLEGRVAVERDLSKLKK